MSFVAGDDIFHWKNWMQILWLMRKFHEFMINSSAPTKQATRTREKKHGFYSELVNVNVANENLLAYNKNMLVIYDVIRVLMMMISKKKQVLK